MSYHPYPSIDRARHQIERHDDETPPLPLFGRRITMSDETRQAMGSRLTQIDASLRVGFLVPEDVRQAMRLPAKVSLQPLADALRKRPVSSEETSA